MNKVTHSKLKQEWRKDRERDAIREMNMDEIRLKEKESKTNV